MKFRTILIPVAAALALAGCGGGSADPAAVVPPPVVTPPVTPPVPPPVTPPPVTPPDTILSLTDSCQFPRTGRDSNNLPFRDRQGTLRDELEWIRLVLDESYLWYKELPALKQSDYSDKLRYFADLKTAALTPSGRAKDRYHFTYPTEQWNAISAGESLGYGITWVKSASGSVPRNWRVAMVQPGSPADRAGFQRGDQIQYVDGIDFVNTREAAAVERMNAALSPLKEGEVHEFWLARSNGQSIRASLAVEQVALDAVANTRVLDTAGGKVGYLTFSNHNNVAEGQLVKAFGQLKEARVSGLVLDLRYNGGGLLQVASEVAYMIAGPERTAGKIFERTLVNDKLRERTPLNFRDRAIGLPGRDAVPAGQALPYLGLDRVTVLAGPGTCSASESVINSLRGIDVQVDIVGGETCGKPYAFTPVSNCGTTYFAIQFQGANHKGWGDYDDGFAPTCRVGDDIDHALGDRSEALLAAALTLQASGTCPAPAASARTRAAAAVPLFVPVRPAAAEIAIRER